ncbi:hypothetical protein OUZ56_030357 [Daphnia magna]|uniref:Uncharacterized protein n=1 Tax=Daphnia magna TaxID=35525 RepID=A0ABQ9ZR22_9CRUS|nr:hypothetical protein OUZ56_030357 [Daphnia magna]
MCDSWLNGRASERYAECLRFDSQKSHVTFQCYKISNSKVRVPSPKICEVLFYKGAIGRTY